MLPGQNLNWRWVVRATVAVVLALTLLGTLLRNTQEQPLRVILGFESQRSFLARRLGWYYRAIEYVNETLPQGSVVLFLWETRSYHCTADCRPDALLDRWWHTIHEHGHDSAAIVSAWRAEGITHVLLHRAGMDHILERGFDPLTSSHVEVLDELETQHLSLVEDFGSAYELYVMETER